MSRSLHFSTLSRTIAAAVAALVLAASAAPAFAASASSSGSGSMCAGLTLAECEQQVLASRGIGPAVSSSDGGSGWTAPAVGAATVAAVSLVGLLGMFAVRRRRHWRLSQSAATH
jgi:hypothetical protein